MNYNRWYRSFQCLGHVSVTQTLLRPYKCVHCMKVISGYFNKLRNVFIHSVASGHFLNTHYMPGSALATGVIKSSKVVPEIRCCPCGRVFWYETLHLSSQRCGEGNIVIGCVLLMRKLRLKELKCSAQGPIRRTCPQDPCCLVSMPSYPFLLSVNWTYDLLFTF